MANTTGKNQKRIQQAWKECESWITDFAGSAIQAYFTEVQMERLPETISSLLKRTRNLRASIFTKGEEQAAEYIALETLYTNVQRLEQGEIDGVSVDFTSSFASFDLDFHLIVYALGENQLEVELVWWSDQVFTDESDEAGDAYQRFEAIMNLFIQLQETFRATHFLMGPELYEHPGPETESWIEV